MSSGDINKSMSLTGQHNYWLLVLAGAVFGGSLPFWLFI